MTAPRETRPASATALAARFEAASLDWIVPAWPAPRGVHAFFTSRNGGVSTGTHASLDLGTPNPPEDPAEHDSIAENRRRVAAFLPATPRWLDQVHGAGVVELFESRATPPSEWPRADAAVTRASEVVLAVRVADCLPVLFADRAGSTVAIAHAGWRGLAAGVLENTVAAMTTARDVVAWLGPAIGSTAFEVGEDVRDAFVAPDPDARDAFVRGRPGKWYADLRALAHRRLRSFGVEDLHDCNACTFSDPARFFSYRRDGATGRMAAFIWRTDRG